MADPPLILVVDDEQSYRDALSIALQREGFLVETMLASFALLPVP